MLRCRRRKERKKTFLGPFHTIRGTISVIEYGLGIGTIVTLTYRRKLKVLSDYLVLYTDHRAVARGLGGNAFQTKSFVSQKKMFPLERRGRGVR